MRPEPHRYCLLPYVYRSYTDLGLSSHQLLESMLKQTKGQCHSPSHSHQAGRPLLDCTNVKKETWHHLSPCSCCLESLNGSRDLHLPGLLGLLSSCEVFKLL